MLLQNSFKLVAGHCVDCRRCQMLPRVGDGSADHHFAREQKLWSGQKGKVLHVSAISANLNRVDSAADEIGWQRAQWLCSEHHGGLNKFKAFSGGHLTIQPVWPCHPSNQGTKKALVKMTPRCAKVTQHQLQKGWLVTGGWVRQGWRQYSCNKDQIIKWWRVWLVVLCKVTLSQPEEEARCCWSFEPLAEPTVREHIAGISLSGDTNFFQCNCARQSLRV